MRALARDVDRARRLLSGADVVGGDLTDAATLTTAVKGVDAVVFTHGATADRGGLRTRRLRRGCQCAASTRRSAAADRADDLDQRHHHHQAGPTQT